MVEWENVKFGEIASFRNGLNFNNKSHGKGCKILGVSDFGDKLIPNYDSLDEINIDGIVKKEDYLEEGDIVFVRSNGNKNLVGRSVIINNKNQKIVYSGFCIRARIFSKNKLPIFYAYFFKTPLFRELISGGTIGANIQNLNQGTLNRILVPNPPLLIQKKIASILSAYDDLIENNLKRIKLLEELAQKTYEEWFVKFTINGEKLAINEETGLPDSWESKKLNEVAYVNKNAISKGFKEKIKYIDISSVSIGSIDSWTEYEFIDAPNRARRIVKHGDIIWSCVRPNRKSYSLVWNPETNLIASTGFAVITPRLLPTSYLYYYLTTDLFVGYLTSLAGGAAYPAVTSNVFENADIIIPEQTVLQLFDNNIKPTIEIISKLKHQNRLLKEARNILLPRLMNGSIEV